jgi:phosphoglucomutase
LRVYIERYVAAGGELGLQTGDALGPLIVAAEELALISAYTQREQPSVIT